VTSLRSRRLLAALALALGLAAAGCSGGDAIPSDPAEGAGSGDAGLGEEGGLEGGGGGDTQPAPGANQPLPDTGDDLEEPTP
jgi:hypothetical protein